MYVETPFANNNQTKAQSQAQAQTADEGRGSKQTNHNHKHIHLYPYILPHLIAYTPLLLINKPLIPLSIIQPLNLTLILNLNLRNPRIALRRLINELRLVLKDRVALNHGARDRAQHVRRRLDGLDGSDGLAGADFEPGLGELDVDDVAEGVGGVFSYANFSCRVTRRSR